MLSSFNPGDVSRGGANIKEYFRLYQINVKLYFIPKKYYFYFGRTI
jgi:hypothetical protein